MPVKEIPSLCCLVPSLWSGYWCAPQPQSMRNPVCSACLSMHAQLCGKLQYSNLMPYNTKVLVLYWHASTQTPEQSHVSWAWTQRTEQQARCYSSTARTHEETCEGAGTCKLDGGAGPCAVRAVHASHTFCRLTSTATFPFATLHPLATMQCSKAITLLDTISRTCVTMSTGAVFMSLLTMRTNVHDFGRM
jgi:hypothetical protein